MPIPPRLPLLLPDPLFEHSERPHRPSPSNAVDVLFDDEQTPPFQRNSYHPQLTTPRRRRVALARTAASETSVARTARTSSRRDRLRRRLGLRHCVRAERRRPPPYPPSHPIGRCDSEDRAPVEPPQQRALTARDDVLLAVWHRLRDTYTAAVAAGPGKLLRTREDGGIDNRMLGRSSRRLLNGDHRVLASGMRAYFRSANVLTALPHTACILEYHRQRTAGGSCTRCHCPRLSLALRRSPLKRAHEAFSASARRPAARCNRTVGSALRGSSAPQTPVHCPTLHAPPCSPVLRTFMATSVAPSRDGRRSADVDGGLAMSQARDARDGDKHTARLEHTALTSAVGGIYSTDA